MAMKNSFVLYTSYQEQIDLLNMEQRGKLLTTIFSYVTKGDAYEEPSDGMVKMAFAFIKADLDRDAEKYIKTCEARRKAGKQGGRPKANTPFKTADGKDIPIGEEAESKCFSKKANGFIEKHMVSKKPDNEYEYDNEYEKKDISTSYEVDSTHSRVMEAWNSQLVPLGITPIRAIAEGTKRTKMLRSRIRQYGLEDVLNTISSVKECSFLHGASWFSFDWFIKPENYQKIHDGNYRDRSGNNPADRFSWIDGWAAGGEQ